MMTTATQNISPHSPLYDRKEAAPQLNISVRTVSKLPMQAHGTEMLRWACIFATEEGGDIYTLPTGRRWMIRATWAPGGFILQADSYIVRYPDRYIDERGVEMWSRVMKLVQEVEVTA